MLDYTDTKSIRSTPSLREKEPQVVVTQEDALLETTQQLKRKLKDRHISLLALAGIIGPGILIGALMALRNGPGSMVVGFGIIGLIAFAMMQLLGELLTLYPSGGAFSTLGAKFIDPAWGGAVGWFYVIIWIGVLANEYNTTAAILEFWGPQVPLYGYVLIFWAFFLGFQFLGVGAFGEAEYWLAWFKLLGLVAFYIFAIVYCAGGIKGHKAFGFHYWNDPGSFNHGFKGVALTFVFALTFYSGTESIAITAGELRNPLRAVPKAIRQTFWRILIVYMGVAVLYGLTVPYNDPGLTLENKTLKLPMSIAIQRAGWSGGVHLVNAFILVTCISAINSLIYIGLRTIVNLAKERNAPWFLGWVNRHGVPYMAVILMNAFGLLSLMNVLTGAAEAYNYIVNISGVAVFIVWGNISLYHIRFRLALKKQGRLTDELPYKGLWYPWIPLFSLVLNVFLALVQGWMYFVPFDAANFVDSYILLPVFPVFYFGLKLINRTKWVTLDKVDLDAGRRVDLDIRDDDEKEVGGWKGVMKEIFT